MTRLGLAHTRLVRVLNARAPASPIFNRRRPRAQLESADLFAGRRGAPGRSARPVARSRPAGVRNAGRPFPGPAARDRHRPRAVWEILADGFGPSPFLGGASTIQQVCPGKVAIIAVRAAGASRYAVRVGARRLSPLRQLSNAGTNASGQRLTRCCMSVSGKPAPVCGPFHSTGAFLYSIPAASRSFVFAMMKKAFGPINWTRVKCSYRALDRVSPGARECLVANTFNVV
jgi:hypothetical protein